jgi:hypothetical protein
MMKLTVVLKLKLLDDFVELTLHKVDLPPKDTDTLTQVFTDVAHGLSPLQARSSDQDAL